MQEIFPNNYTLAYTLLGLGIGALGVAGALLNAQWRAFLQKLVAGIYRTAILVSVNYGDEAIAWLRGPAGVAYRQRLVGLAYDRLPSRWAWLRFGLSREAFIATVSAAFDDMLELADKLYEDQPKPSKDNQ